MGLLEVLKDVLIKFEKENIDYFLVGSMATMYYGRPRFTQDLDLVVRIHPKQVRKFENLFPMSEYYCPPLEIIQMKLPGKVLLILFIIIVVLKLIWLLIVKPSFIIQNFPEEKKS